MKEVIMRKFWTALAFAATVSLAAPQAEAAFPIPANKNQQYSPLDQARHVYKYCHTTRKRGYHCHYRTRHYYYYRPYRHFHHPYFCHDPFFFGSPFFWPHCHWY
jgi:hypothetical protein